MEHGASWFSFLPGYAQLEAYFQHSGVTGSEGMLFGNVLVLQHVAAAALVSLVILLLASISRANLNADPTKGVVPSPDFNVRNVIELALEWVYGQMRQIIGPDAPRYFPVIGTLALFIFFSNILGLMPGFLPPTDNWNTTFACSIFVFLYYNFHGLRVNGWHHIEHMANPTGQAWGWFLAPLMFPIELVGHIARPFSLGIRLSANMIGDHAVLASFLGLVPIFVPLPFIVLGLLVCTIQTVVFVLLTTIYIGLATAEMHHDDHGHDDAHAAAAA